MATKTKLSLYNEKKNSLQPYIDAGNASTTAKTTALKVYPTTSNNMLAKAYSVPKTASTAMPMQSSLQKAYSQPAQQTYTAQASQNVPTATAMNTTTQNTNTPTLQQAYGNSSYNGSYSAARQNALNQAEASYNKLLNYLPEYMELMGMRGLGVSNQALSNAYGTYQQNVNNINAQYDELERAYATEYRDVINSLSGELSAYLAEVGNDFNLDAYNARKQAYINSGMYTAEEIAAAEALMKDSEKNIISDPESNKILSGAKSLSATVYTENGNTTTKNLQISSENVLNKSAVVADWDRIRNTYKNLANIEDPYSSNIKDGTSIQVVISGIPMYMVYYKNNWYVTR